MEPPFQSVSIQVQPAKLKKKLLPVDYVLIGTTITAVTIAALVIVFFISAKLRKGPLSFPVYNDDINVTKELSQVLKKYHDYIALTDPTIMVSISSYRDPELCITIEDLFKKAANPARISVCVVEQNDPKDSISCHARNARVDQNQLRVQTLHYKEAKGPTYARSLCEQLWRGEEYYMMCDSHMRFEPGWDIELLKMLYLTDRPKRTVITWYPEGYERIVEKKTNNIKYKILLRQGWRYEQLKFFNEQGLLEFESVTSFKRPPRKPQPVPIYAACFAFSHSDVLKEVPFHPDTPFLFFGEEMFFAARLLSHGWDLCGCTKSMIYHLWVRTYRKHYWEHDVIKQRDKSIEKIKGIMTGTIIDPVYGMGNKRSWEDIQYYFGIDFDKQKFTRPNKPWKLPADWKPIMDEHVIKTRE